MDNILNDIYNENINDSPDIDLKLLEGLTNLDLSDYDKVIRDNVNLTKEYKPIVSLYGFTDFKDLYKYSLSSKGDITKTVTRYGKDFDVILKSGIKTPLPNKNDKQEPNQVDAENSLSWNTLSSNFGELNPNEYNLLKSVPNTWDIKGNYLYCDDFVFINNPDTVGIVGFKLNKVAILKYAAYMDKSVLNDLIICFVKACQSNYIDIKFDSSIIDHPLITMLTDSTSKHPILTTSDLSVDYG